MVGGQGGLALDLFFSSELRTFNYKQFLSTQFEVEGCFSASYLEGTNNKVCRFKVTFCADLK